MLEGLPPNNAAHRLRLVCDEARARAIVDLIVESFEPAEAAASAFESADGPQGKRAWIVEAYFGFEPDEDALRDLVAAAGGEEAASRVEFSRTEEADWVANSLAGLAPVKAGRFLVHGGHDRARVRPNAIAIEIEAALAFGTGHHGTTRGCLLLLDHVLKGRAVRRVLDLGTGTGVLAIAAAKARRQPVLASDIDAPSVKVAQENAHLNGTGPLIQVIRATGFAAPEFAQNGPFDLVLANILANPLKQLAGPMKRHLAPGALVILSGLLTPQATGVIAAYRARGLVPLRHIRIEGWSSLLLRSLK